MILQCSTSLPLPPPKSCNDLPSAFHHVKSDVSFRGLVPDPYSSGKPSWIALVTYKLAVVGSAGLSSISTFSVSRVLDFFSCLNNCSVQLFSHVQLFVAPWTAACQASLSVTNSLSLLKLMSIELEMPSNHLLLCHPLLLPSTLPSLRVFSNESVHHFRWPENWSFSFSISPSNEHPGLISFRMDSRAQ